MVSAASLWKRFGADIAYPPLRRAIVRAPEDDTPGRRRALPWPNRFGNETPAMLVLGGYSSLSRRTSREKPRAPIAPTTTAAIACRALRPSAGGTLGRTTTGSGAPSGAAGVTRGRLRGHCGRVRRGRPGGREKQQPRRHVGEHHQTQHRPEGGTGRTVQHRLQIDRPDHLEQLEADSREQRRPNRRWRS